MRCPVITLSLAASLALLAGAAAAQPALQVGGPTFYGPFGLGWQLNTVRTGDLTGDGQPDLAVLAYSDLVVLPGRGGAEFASPLDDGPGMQGGNHLVEADLDSDGRLDVIVSNTFADAISVLLNQGGGVFAAPVGYAVPGHPNRVAVGDLDGDGLPDLATANAEGDSAAVLLGLGQGLFGPAAVFPGGNTPRGIALGDLDADGWPDLVLANDAVNRVTVLLGLGGGLFGPPADYVIESRTRAVTIADLDGDGVPDLVAGNLTTQGSVSVLRGLGDGTFAPKLSYPTGSGPISLATGDLNGDGALDVVSANLWSNSLSMLRGTGGGLLGTAVDCLVGDAPISVDLGDFNADGTLDLAASHIGSNDTCVLLNHGPGGDPWCNYGFGFAGTSTFPTLSATGPGGPPAETVVTLAGAAPDAPVWFFVSLANDPTPFKGGQLVPVPVGATIVLATDATGGFQLTWPTWPAGIPSGPGFYVQAAIQAPAAPKGVALSNALQALAP